MRTFVLSGVESAVATAAELVLAILSDLIELDDVSSPVVAFPTGRTMVPLYDELALRHAAGDTTLSRVRGFNLDELLLPSGHPATFATYMHRHAYGRTGLAAARCEIPRSDADPLTECARYDKALASALDGGDLDLAILGLGTDGHVAYNLPGAPVASTHVVELPEALARALEVAPTERPLRAITMGLAPIWKARRVIVLATGAEKAAAVRYLVEGPLDDAWPCSMLCDHPAIDVVLTLEAASEPTGPMQTATPEP
jgi:glucosamine-6-phosphate deaminase